MHFREIKQPILKIAPRVLERVRINYSFRCVMDDEWRAEEEHIEQRMRAYLMGIYESSKSIMRITRNASAPFYF